MKFDDVLAENNARLLSVSSCRFRVHNCRAYDDGSMFQCIFPRLFLAAGRSRCLPASLHFICEKSLGISCLASPLPAYCMW
jgi:hypothetical protein